MNRLMITSAALALMLGGGTAFGAAQWTFKDWDSDGNLELTEREFTEGARQAGVYSDWDADASGDVSEDEFYDGVFSSWDADDDGTITENEFASAGQGWFEDDELSSFDAWDTNDDGVLEQDEFDTVANNTEVYGSWDADADAAVDEDELYTGLYDTADYDDDEVVTEEDDGWFDWF